VQLIQDFLQTKWMYLSQENFIRMIDALTESADYAAEFNANLSLRERLRFCGLMRQPQGSAQPAGATPPRLPHLLEQATAGYSILLRVLTQLYTGAAAKNARDAGWDRRALVERILVR
jgi:hypothetical protein